MRFKIHIDGREHQVDASADGTLSLDGQVFSTKLGSPSEDRRTVQLGDNGYEVRVVENCSDTGIFVLELAGERIPVTVAEVSKGRPGSGERAKTDATATAARTSSTDSSGETGGNHEEAAAPVPQDVKEGVWAPVPGKIVEVLVKPGDTVKEGDPVVILEAMKMENELHAPKNGLVTAVFVKKGDQTDRGQLLVAFE